MKDVGKFIELLDKNRKMIVKGTVYKDKKSNEWYDLMDEIAYNEEKMIEMYMQD